ncbi:diaminopimelate epimerase [Stella sp.]|uniref:diaminopimelate epimerase n=1 Tax=Stella sp. TaxID=2912054 RepID=UPI0035AFBE77
MDQPAAAALPFLKMHGLGNDFVVIDARAGGIAVDPARARAIADRHRGVGCDQLIVIEPPASSLADAFMRIRNPDGSEAEACGNATRCVASLLMAERRSGHAVVETVAGLLDAQAVGDGRIAVDMGPARLDWREIPLAQACDTAHVPVALGPVADPVATSMGNPHATFFVPDLAAIAVADLGPVLERHPMFPERANIGFAQLLAPGRLRLRMWERSAGITLACGSGACAALVAATRRGLVDRKAEIVLDGGALEVEWLRDGHVLMTGPVATAFRGTIDPSLLAAA